LQRLGEPSINPLPPAVTAVPPFTGLAEART
jgi:hypothetical protein